MPDGRLIIVVNAGMGPAIAGHLRELDKRNLADIVLPEPRMAKIDVQGPASVALVRDMISGGAGVLESFPYFTFKGDFDFARSDVMLLDGTPALLSRTGYTGEVGFEIFMPLEKAGAVWDAFLDRGADVGALPCGLAARDSLRAGAVLPLSHQDIGAWPFINNPWSFALPVDREYAGYTKAFLGGEALNPEQREHTLAFAGFDPRRVDVNLGGVFYEERQVGHILTIVTDMAIDRVDGSIASVATSGRPEGWAARGLACGFVKIDRMLEPGARMVLRDRRREIEVEIVENIRPDRTARMKLSRFL